MLEQRFVSGSLDTLVGEVPCVDGTLMARDRWGGLAARWGIGRMRFTVLPGLYALGSPQATSPVLVSANYKMSFDRLRQAMAGRDAWILVLDTRGINVWCAAGKGTFGTDEVVQKLRETGLADVVSHRRLILPQLGAPGVAAHRVKKESGFGVVWGPVRAEDLPAFLDAGLEATAEMRRKRFPLGERAALVPMEVVPALKYLPLVLGAVLLVGGLAGGQRFWAGAVGEAAYAVAAILVAVLAGCVLTPLLLPWLPGRAFSLKGAVAGVVLEAALALGWGVAAGGVRPLHALGWVLAGGALAAFLGLSFTGASTYTSLSGVRKEMRLAVPLTIAGAVVGLSLWIGSLWVT